MVSYYTIQQKTLKLDTYSVHEEKLYEMLKIYLDTFPILDAQLFRYSSLGYLGEGIIALDDAGLRFIRDIRDDVRTLPVVYDAIRRRKTTYQSGIEFFKNAKSDYIIPSHYKAVLVVPIFLHSFILGYICSNQFKESFKPVDKLLQETTYFGECIGKALSDVQTIESHHQNNLSRRELEVMKRVAMGQVAKEMATSMNITEATVQQYVKTAIKKLNAKNRTHAVTLLFQRGIIS